MMDAPTLLNTTLLLLLPLLVAYLTQKVPAIRPMAWLSRIDPIVLAYLGGISLGSLHTIPANTAQPLAALGVALCLPLMLMTLDLRTSFRKFPQAFLALSGFVAIVMSLAVALAPLVNSQPGLASVVPAMVTGTFIGSAPNLASVGFALKIPEAQLALVQSVDLIVSGSFFLFLMACGFPLLYGRLPLVTAPLPPAATPPAAAAQAPRSSLLLVNILVAIAIVAAVSAICLSLDLGHFAILIGICLLSLATGMLPAAGRLADSRVLGERVFLVFCVATGSQLDFGLLTKLPAEFLTFGFSLLLLVILGHLLWCRLMGINRDLYVTTLVAGIFSPAMIAPIASRLKDPQMLAVGIVTGLVGLGIGTLAGLVVHHVIRSFGV